jgi:hypothetical protein
MLPSFVPVPTSSLPEVKVDRLRAAPEFVDDTSAGFVRVYSPIGTVSTIGVTGADARRVVDATVMHSPAFRRMALLSGRLPQRLEPVVDRARSAGIGLGVVGPDGVQAVVSPPAAVLGVPGVLRWWIAELAYEAWLYETAQAVS